MARGWESKSIESQQDDALRNSNLRSGQVPATASKRPALTPDERDRVERRTSLQLALARAQAELQAACRPAHRDMLRMTIESLRAQLAELE